MTTEALILLVLLVLLIGAMPAWPYSGTWGYGPSGVLVLLLVGVLIWTWAEHRPLFRTTGEDIKMTVQDAAQDVKSMGREAADNIRDAVK